MIHKKGFYKLNEFVRPDITEYNIEQFFGVFQRFVRTGKEFTSYQQCGVNELLSLNPTCINFDKVNDIEDYTDLKRRFHYALLSGIESELVAAWRKKYNIYLNEKVFVAFPYYKPFYGARLLGTDTDEAAIKANPDQFFFAFGTLNRSLNDQHPQAKTICRTRLYVTPKGFSFVLCYEYQKSFDGWRHLLAQSPFTEPFTDGLSAAITALREMMDEDLFRPERIEELKFLNSVGIPDKMKRARMSWIEYRMRADKLTFKEACDQSRDRSDIY